MRVLVVEDERKTASFIRKALQAEGFAVDGCHNGQDALIAASATPFDGIVLDIMLPGRDGLSILRQWRERSNATPVLLLSARGEVNERVEGLNTGADDYLPKPFALAEQVARVRALTRRGGEAKSPVLRVANLTLDTLIRRAQRGDADIELTAREYRLLEFLMRSAGRLCGRMRILEKVWDYDFDPGTNLVDVYIRRLREKIDADFEPKLLHTARGVGYVTETGPSINLRVRAADAERFGLTASDIAEAANTAMLGQISSHVLEGDRIVNIRVLENPKNLNTTVALCDLPIRTPGGAVVRLSQVADVTREPRQAELHREDLRQEIAVTARLEGRDLGSAMKEIQAKLSLAGWLPPGTVEYGGLVHFGAAFVGGNSDAVLPAAAIRATASRRGKAGLNDWAWRPFFSTEPCRPGGRVSGLARRWQGLQPALHQVSDDLDRQFHGHDRFADQIVTSVQNGARLRLKFSVTGDENDGCFGVTRQLSHFLAKSDARDARQVDVQQRHIIGILSELFESLERVGDGGGGKVCAGQGQHQGAARYRIIVHHQNHRRREALFVGLVGAGEATGQQFRGR
jgi:DNA-binding response OmpR family regulator